MSQGPRFAVFASGSGSNFQAILEAMNRGELNGELVLVFSDKPDAYVLERSRNAGVEAVAISPSTYPSKTAYEQAILEQLLERDVEWIVLAGYMRLIGEVLLNAYENRIVNIHPSLLPSFPGKDAIGQAMEHGVKITGVTVHLVDSGMDTGPILAQQAVEVVEDNKEATEKRIHAAEHGLYAKTLQHLWHRSKENIHEGL